MRTGKLATAATAAPKEMYWVTRLNVWLTLIGGYLVLRVLMHHSLPCVWFVWMFQKAVPLRGRPVVVLLTSAAASFFGFLAVCVFCRDVIHTPVPSALQVIVTTFYVAAFAQMLVYFLKDIADSRPRPS